MSRSEPLLPVAQTGSTPDTLRALRDRLAEAIDAKDCPPRDLAALSRQLTLVLTELDRLPAAKGSAADELKAARAARQARASGH